MNIHFLELFYYVARHGGISAAVRHIPYGIQQPAVSTQVGKLEIELGVKLFERAPFRLTPAGEALYAHVSPFFEKLPAIETSLREAHAPELRIGGAELILRDHLPSVLRDLKQKFPRLRYSLRTLGYLSEAESWLRQGEIDFALVPLRSKSPAGFRQRPMARLPLVLQVHPKSGYKTSADIFSARRLSLPLISLQKNSSISETFQRELARRGVVWPQSIEATSLDLVQRYVANGDGIGLNVSSDDRKPRGIRVIPLEKFPPVTMGALWRGRLNAASEAAIEAIHAYARARWPAAAC